MSGLTSTLFGSSPSVSTTSPYSTQLGQVMPGLVSNANSLSGNVSGLTNAGQANIGTAATNAANLASGVLPSGYSNAEMQNINNAVQNSLGSGVAGLAASGTLGGTSLNNLTNQIGQNTANAAAQNYNQSMSTANGLNNSLAGIGSQQANLGLGEQSTAQGLLNSLLSQNTTQVNQGSAGILPSALGGYLGGGGTLSGLLGTGSSSSTPNSAYTNAFNQYLL